MTHRATIRVYYEDTDLAGVVYYANYLKFIERGRSDALRQAGVDQNALKADGIVFVVRRVVADYHAPARLDDVLIVETSLIALRGASAVLQQDVLRGETKLFSSEVKIACMDSNGRPCRLPPHAREALNGL